MSATMACPYSPSCDGCRLSLPSPHDCVLKFCDEHPGGATLSEVGEVFGLSRERVRQIETIALARFEALLPLVEAGRSLPEGTDTPAGSRSYRRLAGAARRRLQHDLSLHGLPRPALDERQALSQPMPDPRPVLTPSAAEHSPAQENKS